MNGKTNRSTYVVSVLRNNAPIAFIELRPDGDDADQVDITIAPDASYSEVQEKAQAAVHAIGFLVWKEGGPLPLPRSDIGTVGTGDADEPW